MLLSTSVTSSMMTFFSYLPSEALWSSHGVIVKFCGDIMILCCAIELNYACMLVLIISKQLQDMCSYSEVL